MIAARSRTTQLVSLVIGCIALPASSGNSSPVTPAALPSAGSPSWQVEGNLDGALFGASLGTAGDVNGDGYADVIVSGQGHAFVFLGSAQGPATQPIWTSDVGASSVATAGDVNGDGLDDVIIGGIFNSSRHASVYLGTPSGPAPTAAWFTQGQNESSYGAAVASAGDVNGDGFDDVIVAAPGPGGSPTNPLKVYAYLGSSGGLATTPAWTVVSNQSGATLFGYDVAGVGDVNGDGYDDVLIGEPQFQAFSPGLSCNVGRALLYLGSAAGLPTTPSRILNSDADCAFPQVAFFGCSVSGADVNGDQYADLLIGCSLRGSRLYLGSASGPALSSWTANGIARGAGDVDGDHYDDVIVGDVGPLYGLPVAGTVSLYLGGPAGLSTTAAWSIQGDQPEGNFGAAVAGAGDTDGDGLANVLVGAPLYDHPETDEGVAFLYFGHPSPCERDFDGDGYCASGPGADCDDRDASTHPNATELCNGRDDDCDGAVDDGCTVLDITITYSPKGTALISWRTDAERDLQGFNVVVYDNQGARIQMNLVLIPCEECTTDRGRTYYFYLPKHKGAHNIFIEQVHTDGRIDVFGPAVRQ